MNRPRPSHERMVQVFGFLADFAAAYPGLPEGEQRTYRDLCRAAMLALDDEERAESMLLTREVDEFLFRACRMDIGEWLLRQLRQRGIGVRLVTEGGVRLQMGPEKKLTPAIRARVRRWKQALRDALLSEGLSDPAILKANNAPGLGNRVSSCGKAVPSDGQNGEVKSAGPTRERSTA